MSDKPQENQGDTQTDILEQIITQGLGKTSAPPAEESPPAPGHGDCEQSPPLKKKSRRSAVYIYLIILFGAAFLMLLLAYFIQLRNSETTISDLRNSMTLSREELMDQIEALEGEIQELSTEKTALQTQLDGLKSELDVANANYEALLGGYSKYVGYTSILEALYSSEVKLNDGDYDGAARELAGIDFDYFLAIISEYDADMAKYDPEWMFLQARFDGLISTLTERGLLDESWADRS